MFSLWILSLVILLHAPSVDPLSVQSPQSHTLTVDAGASVTLPCNGTRYLGSDPWGEDDQDFKWEAMGADVVRLLGDEVTEGWAYRGDVELGSMEAIGGGDWSLVLHRVRLSDGMMFECIWRGRRTVSTVWLNVRPPNPKSLYFADEGSDVLLPCYVATSRGQKPQDAYVEWLKGDRLILRLRNGEAAAPSSRHSLVTTGNDANLSLGISGVLPSDQGVYQCFYKQRPFEQKKMGIPENVLLLVVSLGSPVPWNVTTGNRTEMAANGTAGGGATDGPTIAAVTRDYHTEAMQVPITLQTEEQTETATSFPERGGAEEEDEESGLESVQTESPPWVRIGLIGGVLLVTAVIVGVLQTQHQI